MLPLFPDPRAKYEWQGYSLFCTNRNKHIGIDDFAQKGDLEGLEDLKYPRRWHFPLVRGQSRVPCFLLVALEA
jgi:hypothetical protein